LSTLWVGVGQHRGTPEEVSEPPMSENTDRATEAEAEGEGDASMIGIGQQDVTSTGKDVWLVGGIPAFGHTKASGVAVYFYGTGDKTLWACEQHGPFTHNTRKNCPHVEAVKAQKGEQRH
jgi:hypothetical protein